MTAAEKAVCQLLGEILPDEHIEPDLRLESLPIGSFDIIELAVCLEENGWVVDVSRAETAVSVQDLARMVISGI